MGPAPRDLLSHAPGRARVRLAALLGLGLLALWSPARAGDTDSALVSYREARAAGRVGGLEARALSDPAKPSLPPSPVGGVTVALGPWTPEVEAQLEAVKAASRGSMKAFLGAASDVRAVLVAWGRDLLARGGDDLLRLATTDAAGMVRFTDVPAGEWLLVASREGISQTERPFKRRRDDAKYLGSPESTGYTLVSYWRFRVTVTAGRTTEAVLTDRGVWLSAVDTAMRAAQPPPIGTTGPSKHR